jgi:hypothetical protein
VLASLSRLVSPTTEVVSAAPAVRFLANNGTGTFTAVASGQYPAADAEDSLQADAVVVADYTGDGRNDVFVVSARAPNAGDRATRVLVRNLANSAWQRGFARPSLARRVRRPCGGNRRDAPSTWTATATFDLVIVRDEANDAVRNTIVLKNPEMMRRALLLAAAVALLTPSCRRSEAGDDVSPEVAAAVKKTRAAHPELFQRRVILLGFDSCDPDLVDQFIREGKLPNFARMRREGAYGRAALDPADALARWSGPRSPPACRRTRATASSTSSSRPPRAPCPSRAACARRDTVSGTCCRGRGRPSESSAGSSPTPRRRSNGFMVSDRIGRLAFEYLYGAPKDTDGKTWPPELAAEIADEVVDAKDMTLSRIRPVPRHHRQGVRTTPTARSSTRATASATCGSRSPPRRRSATSASASTTEKKPRFFALYFEAMDADQPPLHAVTRRRSRRTCRPTST